MSIESKGDRDIVFTREFAAPRALVWRALTEPALIRRWLGAFDGWEWVTCEMEPRVGGRYRYAWRSTKGQEMGLSGTITEAAAPERLGATELFDDPWYEGAATTLYVLTERNKKTLLTLTVTYADRKTRDTVMAGPASSGLESGFDKLEAVVQSL